MTSGDAHPELTPLYRRVMKRIHPDLAVDEQDRLHCEDLAKQANEAYQAGDYGALRAVLGPQHSVNAESEVAKATRLLKEYLQGLDQKGAGQPAQHTEVEPERECEGDSDDCSLYTEHHFARPHGLPEEVRRKYFAICKTRLREFEAGTGRSWAQYKREADDAYEEENSKP